MTPVLKAVSAPKEGIPLVWNVAILWSILISEMAEHVFMGCPVCGSTRQLQHFGIGPGGEFDDATSPDHVLKLARKFTGGGNKGIHWTHEPLPHELLNGLRQRLQEVIDTIDLNLACAGEMRIRCVTCGTIEGPPAFGINNREYDTANAPHYESAIARARFHDDGSATWEESDIPVDLARALLARLEAAVAQLSGDIDAVDD